MKIILAMSESKAERKKRPSRGTAAILTVVLCALATTACGGSPKVSLPKFPSRVGNFVLGHPVDAERAFQESGGGPRLGNLVAHAFYDADPPRQMWMLLLIIKNPPLQLRPDESAQEYFRRSPSSAPFDYLAATEVDKGAARFICAPGGGDTADECVWQDESLFGQLYSIVQSQLTLDDLSAATMQFQAALEKTST